jgi:hypothetical protein
MGEPMTKAVSTETIDRIESLYLNDLIEGTVEVTKTVTETPKGIITTKSIKRKANPKDRLEFLRTVKPEKWHPPPPQIPYQFDINTIDCGLRDLESLLLTVENNAPIEVSSRPAELS